MDDEVVEPGHLHEVASAWIDGLENDKGTDTGLERAVEGVSRRWALF